MSEQNEAQEAPITITLKGGAGFEAPWLVLRAQSAEDAVALLGETELAELPKLVGEYAASFREKAGAAPSGTAGGARTSSPRSQAARPSTQGRPGASRGAAPQTTAQNQENGNVEYHPEGNQCPADGETLVYKKINAKSGKTFEMWVCPNQRSRGDGHESQFIN